MRSTGIRRKVDDLGRVVIPVGIRRSLEIHEGDPLEVSVDGENIVLRKPADRCVFCGTETGLVAFRGKGVCRACSSSVGLLGDVPPTAAAPSDDPGRDEDLIVPPFAADYDPASSTAW